jgi:methyl-accepting chemotaxis protein
VNIKLLLPTIVLSIALAALGYISNHSLKKTGVLYSRVTNESIPNIKLTQEMFLAFRSVRISLRTLGIEGITQAQGQSAISDTEIAIAQFEESEKKYRKLEFIPGEKELYDQVHNEWISFKKLGARVIRLYTENPIKNRNELKGIFVSDCPESAEVFKQKIVKLVNFHTEKAALWSNESSQIADEAKKLVLSVAIFSVLLGIGLSAFSLFSIKTLMSLIRSVVAQMSKNFNKLEEVTQNLYSSSETLTTGAAQQASAVQETSVALEESSTTIKKTSENTEHCQKIANESKEAAEKGKTSIDEVYKSLNSVEESNDQIILQINESQKEMSEIIKIIHEIGVKTKVINEIVFQTRLLSFNASVEAARAGEHGKGFSVVAEEVGNLAKMSGDAAQEITNLLDVSVKKVEQIAASVKTNTDRAINDSKQKISASNSTAQICKDALGEIVSKVIILDDLIKEITSATKEQANGLSEINKAISDIDAGAQSFNKISTQTSTDAQILKSQTENLTDELTKLSSIIGMDG